MPRGPRIDYPGAIHHVIVRGVERRLVFLDDADRRELLRRIALVFAECDLPCFAWALMPNHFHLVVRTVSIPLRSAMHRVLTGYVMYFNKRYARVGHLVQNRFKSRLAEDDADLLGLVRYVHRNPLRGDIVGSLEELAQFAWCGHGALVGTLPPEPFHSVHDALSLFGSTPEEARARLSRWMRETRLPEGTQRAERADPGSRRHALVELYQDALRTAGVGPTAFRLGRDLAVRRARAELARRALDELELAASDVGSILGLSRSTVSRGAREGRRLRRLGLS
jgi:REP element-mobilizing transposase RayT